MKLVQNYKEWRIWKLSVTTPAGSPLYVAIKNRDNAIEGVDISDLIADIEEAER